MFANKIFIIDFFAYVQFNTKLYCLYYLFINIIKNIIKNSKV